MSKRFREENHIEYFDILEHESPFKKMKKENSFLFTNKLKRFREERPEDILDYESPLKKQKTLSNVDNDYYFINQKTDLFMVNLTNQLHWVTL